MDSLIPELEPHAFGSKAKKSSRKGDFKMNAKMRNDDIQSVHLKSIKSFKQQNIRGMSQAKAPKLGIPDFPPTSLKSKKNENEINAKDSLRSRDP